MSGATGPQGMSIPADDPSPGAMSVRSMDQEGLPGELPGLLVERLDELALLMGNVLLTGSEVSGQQSSRPEASFLDHETATMATLAVDVGREYVGNLLASSMRGGHLRAETGFGCHRAFGARMCRLGADIRVLLEQHEAGCQRVFEEISDKTWLGRPPGLAARVTLSAIARSAIGVTSRGASAICEGYVASLRVGADSHGRSALETLLHGDSSAACEVLEGIEEGLGFPGDGGQRSWSWSVAVVRFSFFGAVEQGQERLSRIADAGASSLQSLFAVILSPAVGGLAEVITAGPDWRDIELVAALPGYEGAGAVPEKAGGLPAGRGYGRTDALLEEAIRKAFSDLELPSCLVVRAGIGQAAPGVEGLRQSYKDARSCIRLLRGLPGRLETLAARRALVRLLLAESKLRSEQIEQVALGGLASWVRRGVGEDPVLLKAAVGAFIAAGQNALAAARKLGVHRHTLTTRLHRFEDMTGLSLDDPDDLLLVSLALRVGDLRHLRERPDLEGSLQANGTAVLS